MEKMNINPAVKAALLSGLLFPGAGQLFLKRYYRGAAIIAFSLTSILFLIFYMVIVGQKVLSSSPLKGTAFNLKAFFFLMFDIIKSLNFTYILLIFLVIFLVWIISIIDAYHFGKKEFLNNHP